MEQKTSVSKQLKLEEHLRACGFTAKEVKQALTSIISRAIFSSSEWKTAQLLQDNSSLCELLGADIPTHKELYAITDKLYEHREKIDSLLYAHIKHLFNLEDKIVIFDLSNTYFETAKPGSALAKHGRSKEKRTPDTVVAYSPDYCNTCGCDISDVVASLAHKRQEFTIPETIAKNIEHQSYSKLCSRCGTKTTSKFPKDITSPVQYGRKIRAIVTYLHTYHYLPYKRLKGILHDLFDISLSEGTIANMLKKSAFLSLPTYKEILKFKKVKVGLNFKSSSPLS